MKYVVCLPFVYRPYAEACKATIKIPEENMFYVDNTEYNNGIMRSHNLGVDAMYERDADWLVIMSAAIRFGSYAGGMDFITELEEHPNNLVLEAAGVNGWHLIAFQRKLIEQVGRWDENFHPYGYDDLDYSYRIQLAFNKAHLEDPSVQLWEKVNVNVHDMGMAHSLKLAGVETHNEQLRAYYWQKWGIMPEDDHNQAYKAPFNNIENSIKYWPPGSLAGEWNKNWQEVET